MAAPAAPRHDVLQGVVERVTYSSPESGYTVVKLSSERGYDDPVSPLAAGRATAVGVPATPFAEGQRLRLTGHWTDHAVHGRQFRFRTAETLPPLDREGLVRYLASSAFRGIGPTLAERIVDKLGSNALSAIRDDPEALAGIRGLRREVRSELAETIRGELGNQELIAFLLGAGLGPWQAEAVAKKHDEATLRADPYVMARGIAGIGFQTADRLAREGLGFAEDAPERRRAAFVECLRGAAQDGHTLLSLDDLTEAASRLLRRPIGADERDEDLALLERERAVVVDEQGVYLPYLFASERGLARNLHALLASGPARPLGNPADLAAAEARAGLELHPDQRAAVLGLLSTPLGLLTGGPGVGKTTIVRLVVELAEGASACVRLASPTGRAAKRLAEATGRDASTIHRLLGWEPAKEGFQHDDEMPLEADLVVVDEISMLDVVLAHHLVKAIQPPARLLMVGDPDQLPSVSAGNVLADLLACGRVPVWRLTHIYRQARESLIVRNAHHVLEGEELELPRADDPLSDFYFFPADGDEHAAERLVEVVTRRIPDTFDMDWVRDVQVLAPMYRGPCGVDALNERLRAALGIGGLEVRWHGRAWRIGDRVIHTRNDYEKEVFNGDMGRIVRVDADGPTVTVRFPERDVAYAKDELADLQPAFAITVHRSQGGEYPAVVLPLVPSHHLMLQRHLLYTAVTRARRLVVLVGSLRAVRTAIANAAQAERSSALGQRLRALPEA